MALRLFAFPTSDGGVNPALIDDKGYNLTFSWQHEFSGGRALLSENVEPGWFVAHVPAGMSSLSATEIATRLRCCLEPSPSNEDILAKKTECAEFVKESIAQVLRPNESVREKHFGRSGGPVNFVLQLTSANSRIEVGIPIITIRDLWQRKGLGSAIFSAVEEHPAVCRVGVYQAITDSIQSFLKNRRYRCVGTDFFKDTLK